MCLAVYAGKGTDKYSTKLIEGIKTASVTNDDGMGFAFKRNSTKKVYISKGYEDVTTLLEAISRRKLKDEDELIVHLRIGNKGAINTDMCHPFVCSDDQEEVLLNDKFSDKPVFIHNGTLIKYSEYNSKYSDTFFFAKDFMSYKSVQNFLKDDKDLFAKLMKDHISTSRFVFLFPNEATDAILLGEFLEDDGYYFSNASYKNSNIRNVGGYEQHFSTSDYDEYDYETGYYRHGYPKREVNRYNKNVLNSKIKDNFIEELNKNTLNEPITYEKNNTSTPIVTWKDAGDNIDDIKIPANTPGVVSFDCPDTGRKFVYYMGLWLPQSYKASRQRESCKISLNELNYSELVLKCIYDADLKGFIKGRTYKVIKYDYSQSFLDKIHTIRPMYINNSAHESSYLTEEEIYTNFEITPDSRHSEIYNIYWNLVREIDISKNEIKRLNKMLRNDTWSSLFNYKDQGFINRKILELFQLNMYKQLFNKQDYIKEYNLKTY